MTTLTVLQTLAGLGMLVVGAEWLVRGASRLAAALGISALVIGLTVVAYGTSAPEVAVSIQAAIDGRPDLAVGNAVGSNIFNVLFILGLSALIAPLVVSKQLIRWDVPLMIGVSILAYLMSLDGMIGTWDGAILVAGLIVYTVWSIRQGRKESRESSGDVERTQRTPKQMAINGGLILLGLATLVLGSRWLVEGASEVARYLGVSELIIGLTIVAAGTSLPEVATSIIASIRGQRDIAVGNVVGSNLFNILSVLGIASLVAPGRGIPVSPAVLAFDMPVMLAVAVACLPVFFHQGMINRWEGALFLFNYVAYVGYMILDATGHDALPMYSAIMLEFVLPITVLTLAIVVTRFIRSGSARPVG
jgi:cation:H+ antiporter